MNPTKVDAVMVDDVVTVDTATPFKQVARLLRRNRVGGLPVTDADGRVVGVVSETDLVLHQSRAGTRRARPWRLRRAAERAGTAGGLMTAPAVTVRTGTTVAEAARAMVRHHVDRLPVVDEEARLVGIVARADLLRVFLRSDADIRRDVEQEVLVRTLWLTPRLVDVSVRDGVVTLSGRLERRSEKSVALDMTHRVDGVVAVVDELTYRVDDRRLLPAEQALHGSADDWLRGL